MWRIDRFLFFPTHPILVSVSRTFKKSSGSLRATSIIFSGDQSTVSSTMTLISKHKCFYYLSKLLTLARDSLRISRVSLYAILLIHLLSQNSSNTIFSSKIFIDAHENTKQTPLTHWKILRDKHTRYDHTCNRHDHTHQRDKSPFRLSSIFSHMNLFTGLLVSHSFSFVTNPGKCFQFT